MSCVFAQDGSIQKTVLAQPRKTGYHPNMTEKFVYIIVKHQTNIPTITDQEQIMAPTGTTFSRSHGAELPLSVLGWH